MKFLNWIFAIVILAAIGSGIYLYKANLLDEQAAQDAMMPEPVAFVESLEVPSVAYTKSINVNGHVRAPQHVEMMNELAGKIVTLNLPAGEVVKKGTLLLEINHDAEDAQLLAAKAQLKLNQQTLARHAKLHKRKEISDELFDQSQAAVDIAKADIALLQNSISKKQLRAPFDATIGIHHLEVGQYLQANSDIVSLVGTQDHIWVDFSMPQVYNELAVGDAVSIQKISTKESFDARVIAVDPHLSASTRNLKYRAQLSNDYVALKPNTLVGVTVPVAPENELVSIPDVAIKRDQLGNFVFLLTPEEGGAYRASLQKITVEERVGDQVLVSDGIQPGQLIAAKGSFKLRPQMKVIVQNGDGMPASSGGE
ncbi:efflux RND transporter periplasmic adaptor subunit [Thalassotalea agarivorans]|uniref:Membrane fusion protein, multidrug efflux system n=1 Tax=Thalassotalea agarivorans TaxID=349064 RepID=A0A1H9Y3Z5_THASX|nr:efflux RND transporter periplasmic adaptor subunit [Thalassotalea agarivorans]SES63576.1 membrane fusion protein, multidrug efflux system [Thalassotalea agarivorans]